MSDTFASQGWIVKDRFEHNGRQWSVVWYRGSHYARDDRGNDTGPYSTATEARDWVEAIRP